VTPADQQVVLPLFPESLKSYTKCSFAMVLLAKVCLVRVESFFSFHIAGFQTCKSS
jgi:hypothetical protein